MENGVLSRRVWYGGGLVGAEGYERRLTPLDSTPTMRLSFLLAGVYIQLQCLCRDGKRFVKLSQRHGY